MLVDNANAAANPLIQPVTVQSSDYPAISQAHENTAESITPASSNSKPQRIQEPQQKLKKKVHFTTEQTNVLEQIFTNNKYLPTHKRTQLAQALALTERQIYVWFQNRRSKWRRIMKYKEEEGDVPASVSTSSISHHQYRHGI
uniref:Homeobox domain-containing protein n=1 Tax=Acrobeloides nanus TaxID=290746 RepID=A0A914CKW1_9BILA